MTSTTSSSTATSPQEWDSIFQFSLDPSTPVPATRQYTPFRRQVPTPPPSHRGSADQDEESESTVVSVSTTFHPSANLDLRPTDVCLLSADSVFFYVQSHKLLSVSSNSFNGLLPPDPNTEHPVVALPEHSAELNVLLHTIYDLSASHYSPTLPVVIAAVDIMQVYGMSPSAFFSRSSPLFLQIITLCPTAPMDCYALAASYDLYELAVAISSFLLNFPLSNITDELASRIGPKYLKRLFFLHLGRVEALKRLLLPPPQGHVSTAVCDVIEQKKLTRAWALATAYLAWEAKADISTASIEAALRPLADHLTCEQCRAILGDRVNSLVVQWSVVKRTI